MESIGQHKTGELNKAHFLGICKTDKDKFGLINGGSDGGRTRVLKQILPASTCLEGLKNFTL